MAARRHKLVYTKDALPIEARVMARIPHAHADGVHVGFFYGERKLCEWHTSDEALRYIQRAGYLAAPRHVGLIATATETGIAAQIVLVVPVDDTLDDPDDEWEEVPADDEPKDAVGVVDHLDVLGPAGQVDEPDDVPDEDDELDDDPTPRAPWAIAATNFERATGREKAPDHRAADDSTVSNDDSDEPCLPTDLIVIGTVFRAREDLEAPERLDDEIMCLLHDVVYGPRPSTTSVDTQAAIDAFLASL